MFARFVITCYPDKMAAEKIKDRFKDELKELADYGAMPIKVKCGEFFTIPSVIRLLNSLKEEINEIKKQQEK